MHSEIVTDDDADEAAYGLETAVPKLLLPGTFHFHSYHRKYFVEINFLVKK